MPVIEFGKGQGRRDWRPFPKQRAFLQAEEDEVLFGGAAGPGKTEALLIYSIKRRLSIPGSRGLFARRELTRLERSAIPRSHEILAGTGARFVGGNKNTWTFPNGSVLEFGGAKDPEDVFNYSGAEYDDICIDELTEWEQDMYLFMVRVCRTTKPGVRPQIRCASNPLNIGHAWVKERWRIDDPDEHAFTTTIEIPGLGPMQKSFRYIPSTVFDNPIYAKEHPEYVAQLMQLPEPMRSAYLRGDWNVAEGAYFGEWRADLHVCDPFEIPDGWTRFRAMDWGFNAPFWIGWFAIDYDGRLWLYREWYGCRDDRPNTGIRLTVPEVADGIRSRERPGEEIRYSVADPSIWSRQGHSGPSIGEEFLLCGVNWQRADNDRIQGWMQVHKRLAAMPDGRPGLMVFRGCRGVARTLPVLMPDPARPEDVDTRMEDHPADGLRYACMSRPLAPKPAVPERKSEVAREIERVLASRERAWEGSWI
ncbi:MAG TPA: terminase family protein [Gemmatimonadales bacterium]